MLDEFRDILAPLDQGRHAQRNHVEPMVQVLPEAGRRHLPLKVAAGGRNDAHVHGHLRAAAHALEFLLDEHAQQLALRIDGHVGHLVDIERAVMRLFEGADFPRGLAGFLDAEKLVLDAVRGHGCGVDRHERPIDPA